MEFFEIKLVTFLLLHLISEIVYLGEACEVYQGTYGSEEWYK